MISMILKLVKDINLPYIILLNFDGTLNENVPEKYQGLSVIEARNLVLKDLEE